MRPSKVRQKKLALFVLWMGISQCSKHMGGLARAVWMAIAFKHTRCTKSFYRVVHIRWSLMRWDCVRILFLSCLNTQLKKLKRDSTRVFSTAFVKVLLKYEGATLRLNNVEWLFSERCIVNSLRLLIPHRDNRPRFVCSSKIILNGEMNFIVAVVYCVSFRLVSMIKCAFQENCISWSQKLCLFSLMSVCESFKMRRVSECFLG